MPDYLLHFRTYEGNAADFKTFFDHYELQNGYVPPLNPNVRVKRKAKASMVCRFCGKENGDTTFNSKPHIISRLFTANTGISDFECDQCNNHFSKFETSTADFLGINRTLFAQGKDKVPVFKSPDGSIEARETEVFGQKAIEISAKIPGLIKSLDTTGEISLEFKSTPYVPLNVYKTLLKIALTVMPEADFPDYRIALQFLMRGLNTKHFAHFAAKVYRTTFVGEVTMPYCFLFKKKDFQSELPSHIFQLYFQDTCIQFHLPFHKNDKAFAEGETMRIIMCPPLIMTDESPSGSPSVDIINLSSTQKVLKETRKMSINFDKEQLLSSIPVDVNTGEILNRKFDDKEIVKIYFSRDLPGGLTP